MTHEEKCGNSLLTIYTDSAGYDAFNVVRWCEKCGAIVVDLEYDGRIQPGRIMKMRFPSNS